MHLKTNKGLAQEATWGLWYALFMITTQMSYFILSDIYDTAKTLNTSTSELIMNNI